MDLLIVGGAEDQSPLLVESVWKQICRDFSLATTKLGSCRSDTEAAVALPKGPPNGHGGEP